MRLFIAEKSELAKAIVEGLGGGQRLQGYWQCGDDAVVPCVGHMLELLEPHEYDPRFKQWRMADLPWSAIPWQKKPVERTADQFKLIVSLISRADSVVHAGDPDDEGQLIVDEILSFVGYKGPVKRVLINDNNTKIVQRAIANLRDNQEFAGLSAAADARSIGDLLYGVNMTRAVTLKAQEKGYQEVLHIGRVQTPITGLVVRRCRQHASHSAAFYYNVTAQFEFNGVQFPARYQVQPADAVDEKGRLSDKPSATLIAASVSGKPAKLVSLVTTRGKEKAPPLPYNLLKLQTDASRKFGYKPDQVKEITQTLREKHRLITYNRSDSEYLSDEQHDDASGVLAAIAQTAPALAPAVGRADPKVKSRAFNSKKVSAHHAIIPTQATANFAVLTEPEQRIYMLIARAYVAQFWPQYVYDETKIIAESEGRKFAVTSAVQTQAGWVTLYKNDAGNEDLEKDEDELTVDVRSLKTGDTGNCLSAKCEDMKTKPLPLYTIATLLTDLTRVAKYIKDDHLRKVLVDKDKDKAGEHGGIGTPATRDTIIAGLFEDGYLVEVKNGSALNVVATKKAEEFYDALPDQARFPDMTALWHEQQQRIASGERDALSFVNELIEYITREVRRIEVEGVNVTAKIYPCTKCKKPMRRLKSEKGFFWACTDRETCKHIMNDRNGQPVERVQHVVSSVHKCQAPGCGKGLIQRFDGRVPPGKKTAPPWWSCSGFPDCKQSYPDLRGKPNYEPRKAKA